ncbi:hypothetical protein NDU88_003108 [Pleurodeles waltl]|uniref:Uncharacterized protein n=1 Tax=Pleurodeles waltl TaxID=8319 RepID=A0AAV7KUQ5_PLEWA|nr:hypothetical protein NDU88_003108 [Pleurodeles waltl]
MGGGGNKRQGEGFGKAVSAPHGSPTPLTSLRRVALEPNSPGAARRTAPHPESSRDPLFQRVRASRKPPGAACLTPSPPRDAASPSELGETALTLQQRLWRLQPGFLVGSG